MDYFKNILKVIFCSLVFFVINIKGYIIDFIIISVIYKISILKLFNLFKIKVLYFYFLI